MDCICAACNDVLETREEQEEGFCWTCTSFFSREELLEQVFDRKKLVEHFWKHYKADVGLNEWK